VAFWALSGTGALAQKSGRYEQDNEARGFSAYDTTTTDVVPLGGGRSLLHLHSWGLFYTNDPTSPFNQSRYDCFGTHALESETGKSLMGQGYCVGVGPKGDIWWIDWTGDLEGGSWTFTGGSGKFAHVSGGGTWWSAQGGGPSETVTTWEGNWRIPK